MLGRMDAWLGNSRCGGIGDVATGVSAIFVAVLLTQQAVGARRAAYAWSLFGIADLVIAVTMGALTSPGLPPHLLAFDARTFSSHPIRWSWYRPSRSRLP